MMVGKTPAGHQMMKDKLIPLTTRQRMTFIQLDSRRTLEQVRAATAAAGATQEVVNKRFELCLI